MSSLGTQFLFQCKSNYFENIRPSNVNCNNTEGYKTLIKIASKFFKEKRYDEFILFFQEYQYNVNLWAAHFVILYGCPNDKVKNEAIEIIERYSNTPMDEKLATEEKEWLKKYHNRI